MITKVIKKCLETKDNKNMMIQWDTVKAVLRGMFIAIHSYLKKQKKISNKQPNLTHKAIRERKNKNPK